MDKSNPKLAVEYLEQAVVATLTDRKILDEADIRALEDSVMPLIGADEQACLILDFSNVEFLTSAALGLLIRISKKVYESGGNLKLCGISPKILEIFRITRLDKIFDICIDRQDAVQSLG
jgi:anti-sigma B factor antagonist